MFSPKEHDRVHAFRLLSALANLDTILVKLKTDTSIFLDPAQAVV